MKKPKRKRTAAEKRARRERKKKYMTIFVHGKQKRVLRPELIDGLVVDEFIARNADPIWLHENGLWELIAPTASFETASRASTDGGERVPEPVKIASPTLADECL